MPIRESSFLEAVGRRLTETLESSDAAELENVAAASGADRAADCRRGEIVTIFGRIRTVTYGLGDSELGVTAEIFDGSAPVNAVWIGRRTIPGVEVGHCIQIDGRLAERDGHKVIYNPRYELREFIAISRREGARL